MSYLLHKLQSMVLVVSAVGWLTTEFAVVCWIGGEIFRDVNAEKHARMKTRAKDPCQNNIPYFFLRVGVMR